MASVEEDAGTGVEIRLQVEDDEDGAARGYEATLDMHTGEHVATMHAVDTQRRAGDGWYPAQRHDVGTWFALIRGAKDQFWAADQA